MRKVRRVHPFMVIVTYLDGGQFAIFCDKYEDAEKYRIQAEELIGYNVDIYCCRMVTDGDETYPEYFLFRT